MVAFFKSRRGTTSVEFALIATVLFLILFGIIDMARMMWEWNAASKAVHWGARFAIVNDPVPEDLKNFDCLDAVAGNGLDCPVSAVSPNPVICTSTGCNGYGFDGDAFDAIVARMQAIDSRIQPENVQIEYQHVGLGMAGNPYGGDIDPVVTVRLQGMVFNLVTPVLASLFSVPFPDFLTSLTAEDLSS